MKKSLLIVSLLAVAALTACSKKEETTVTPAPVVAPEAAPAAAPAAPAADAAAPAPAPEAAASAPAASK